ncbi:hypothetical protein WBO78_25860 [Bosea sp. CCNWLW174]|uniref:hypothetical protein n=1 Tax=unclassified Bosea (in: a-proteobacteria) TaxID=2653178 RepID=UPI0030148F36
MRTIDLEIGRSFHSVGTGGRQCHTGPNLERPDAGTNTRPGAIPGEGEPRRSRYTGRKCSSTNRQRRGNADLAIALKTGDRGRVTREIDCRIVVDREGFSLAQHGAERMNDDTTGPYEHRRQGTAVHDNIETDSSCPFPAIEVDIARIRGRPEIDSRSCQETVEVDIHGMSGNRRYPTD